MLEDFGSISQVFVGQLHESLKRCIDLIVHLIACVESHVSTPNSFFETNTVLPFIMEQSFAVLKLLQHASASCFPSTSTSSSSSPSSIAYGVTPRPLDFGRIRNLCTSGLNLPDNADLTQEHSSHVKFCSELCHAVQQVKGLFALPFPPNSSASQELLHAAASAQVTRQS